MSRSILRRVTDAGVALWHRPFVRNVFTLQIGSVFARMQGIIKSVIIARLLGLDGFGLYAVALSFIGLFGLVTGLGQDKALIIYLAEEHGKQNRSGMRAVIKYFCVLSILSALFLILMAIASGSIARLFYGTDAGEIGAMATIGLLAAAISLFTPLIISLLQILGRIRLMTVLENMDLLGQLLFSVLFLLLGFGPRGIFLGLLVSNLLMACVYIMIYLRLRKRDILPGLWESIRSDASIKPYTMQGLWIAVDKNVGNYFPDGLMFLLGLFATPAAVGIAKLALSLSDLPGGLLLAQTVRMTQSTIPRMLTSGIGKLRAHCALLIKHTLFFHALLVFGGMICFPIAVIVVYGWQYAGVITPMWWLLLIRLLQPFNVANVSILRLFRKMHLSTAWNAARIPVELALFFLLLSFPQFCSPLTAMILTLLLHQSAGLMENVYIYGYLLKPTAR